MTLYKGYAPHIRLICIFMRIISCYNRFMENVSLRELLASRERRAAKQKGLLAANPGCALVCLTVNTPGPVKRLPAADRVFAAGSGALERALAAYGVRQRDCVDAPTGQEGYWVVDAAAEAIKRLCCGLEASLSYGRLLDIDVLEQDGMPLSRTALGLPARGCLVCGRPGADCASRRLHPPDELIAAFEAMAEGTE